MQSVEQSLEQVVHVLLEVGAVLQLLPERDEGCHRRGRHTDVRIVDAGNDRGQKPIAVLLLHVRRLVIADLAHRPECGVPHPGVRMLKVLEDELHTLIDPILVLQVLDDLRQAHDRGPHGLPRGVGPLQRSPNHLEQYRHEDVLIECFREAIQVLLADADDGVVALVLVRVLALLRPGVDVLFDLGHPIHSQDRQRLKQQVPLGFRDVLREVHSQRHDSLHGAVTDVLHREGLRTRGRDLDQRFGQVLKAAGLLEETRLGLGRLDEDLQSLLQRILVHVGGEGLQYSDHLRHDLHQRCGRLALGGQQQQVLVQHLDHGEDELRPGGADLGRLVPQDAGQHPHERGPVRVREEAFAEGRHHVLKHPDGDDSDGGLAACGCELRQGRQ
mmetsp:Transcript_38513/g.111067  ORF Transcript_38513/g.111067 Transcript_38513/m.111067 type:complete len:386 (+) Transcript_38513:426-1583(+)